MKIEPRSLTMPSEAIAPAASPPASGVDGAMTPAKPEPGPFSKVFARAVQAANANENRLQEITHSGKAPPLAPEELLALQADVSRYGATVDLTSKVVAQGTQGIQTVLKGGGQ
jgi:type III secretion system YscI/HrpB-like protein